VRSSSIQSRAKHSNETRSSIGITTTAVAVAIAAGVVADLITNALGETPNALPAQTIK